MMSLASIPHPSMSDEARMSQATFRVIMDAMARPGTICNLNSIPASPSGLSGATAAIVLALTDFETTVWLDPGLSNLSDVGAHIRFSTGAKLVDAPDAADFAIVSNPLAMPALTKFAQGTLEYPDRSTTVIVQVEELRQHGWRLQGPGIEVARDFSAHPIPVDFISQLQENRRTFPRGVDLLFVAGNEIAALPRSTRVSEST